jgi:hypothetical protein
MTEDGDMIERGRTVGVTTATGEKVVMRALGGPTRGRDFVVVWVSTEDEYQAALLEGREPDGLP